MITINTTIYYSSTEICKMFKITPKTLMTWRINGLTHFKRDSKHFYFTIEHIKSFLIGKEINGK